MKELKEIRRTAKAPPTEKKKEPKPMRIDKKYIEDISKLHIEPDDIILIKFDKKISESIRQQILRSFSQIKELDGHFILGMDSKIEISAVKEEHLNQAGWFKKSITWKKLGEIKEQQSLELEFMAQFLFMTPVLIAKNLKDPKMQNVLLDNRCLIKLNNAGII